MRIVVADRFPVLGAAVADIVRSLAPDLEIILVDSAADAARAARSQPVDILLCGWSTGAQWRSTWLPDLAAAAHPGKLVVLGPGPDRMACELAVAAGAWAHLSMTSSAEEIAAAVSLVMAGGTWFPEIQPDAAGPGRGDEAQGVASLSQRQVQVLAEIEHGRSNKEIAGALGISVATVKLHVQAILKTLGVRNRTAAARRARETMSTI